MGEAKKWLQPKPISSASRPISRRKSAAGCRICSSERRLSAKTLEAYERDLRQCLVFLSEHWGGRVSLKQFAKLEAADVRAFMAMRRADDIASRSLMRTLAGLR